MEKAKKSVDFAVGWLCILLLATMTVLVTYQVVVRYFFNNPSAISEATSKYMFVWLVMFGSAYVFGLREHMNIGFVRDRMPDRVRILVEMLCEVIILLFISGVFLYGGFQQASKQMIQLDAALQIPIGYIYAAVPLSGLCIVFYFIYNEYILVKELLALGKPARADGQ